MSAPCPLCGDTFEDDEAYAAHLADAHGLVDDEGAETTTVEHALVVSGLAADRELADAADAAKAASLAGLTDEDADVVHPSRIYDPNQDDHRFKPFVLGLAGLLLLAAVGGGIVATSGGGPDGREVAASETTLAGAPVSDALVPPTTSAPDGAPVDAAAAPTETTVAVATTAAPVVTTTAPPTTAPPTTARPPVTSPPTTAAPPPPPPPPTTAAPPPPPPPTTARPQYTAPALSGARIEACTRRGPDGTWTFSYVLSGGANWAPAPGAQSLGGGRYQEARTGRRSSGFPASSIVVIDSTTGQARSITLSPQLQGDGC